MLDLWKPRVHSPTSPLKVPHMEGDVKFLIQRVAASLSRYYWAG